MQAKNIALKLKNICITARNTFITITKVNITTNLYKSAITCGSCHSTGSDLLVLDAIQVVMLFRQAYRRFSAILRSQMLPLLF